MKIPPSIVLAVAVLCLAVSRASAHERDLRTQTDAGAATEINFCARPSPNAFGFPGHAFVAFSERPSGGGRTFRAVGHTVASGIGAAAALFTYFGGSVSGQQMEERYTHVKQDCLTVKVDRSVYRQALAAARPTLTAVGIPDNAAATAERYALNGNDCIDFILRIAETLRSAGLTVPARSATDTPMQYVRKLVSANP